MRRKWIKEVVRVFSADYFFKPGLMVLQRPTRMKNNEKR